MATAASRFRSSFGGPRSLAQLGVDADCDGLEEQDLGFVCPMTPTGVLSRTHSLVTAMLLKGRNGAVGGQGESWPLGKDEPIWLQWCYCCAGCGLLCLRRGAYLALVLLLSDGFFWSFFEMPMLRTCCSRGGGREVEEVEKRSGGLFGLFWSFFEMPMIREVAEEKWRKSGGSGGGGGREVEARKEEVEQLHRDHHRLVSIHRSL